MQMGQKLLMLLARLEVAMEAMEVWVAIMGLKFIILLESDEIYAERSTIGKLIDCFKI
jgi:hypothetical protein